MLLQNKTIYSQYPVTFSGGATGNERSQKGHRGVTNANKYIGFAGLNKACGVPRGYGVHYGFGKRLTIIGVTPSNTLYTDISITNNAVGVGAISIARITGLKEAFCNIAGTSFIGVADKVSLIAIAKLTSDIVGLATVNADIAALVNMVAGIDGAADVEAALGGISLAICNIIGESSVNADVVANALITSDITGNSTFDADIIASMYIVATILAQSVLNGDIEADAFMTSDIYMGATVDPLSPTALATAVWNAVANEFNDSGSMGNKLNTASSGGVDLDALADAVWNKTLP